MVTNIRAMGHGHGMDERPPGTGVRVPHTGAGHRPTPAEHALLAHAGPAYLEAGEVETPESTLAATVEPDDWRLFHLMRELPEADRARVLGFTEMLFNLRHAQRWAVGEEGPSQLRDHEGLGT